MIDNVFTKSAKVAKKAAKGVPVKVANRSSRVKKKIAAASPKGADKGERSAKTKSGVELAFKLIDNRRKVLGDWRGKRLQKVREIIREADPEIGEEWKWETPVI